MMGTSIEQIEKTYGNLFPDALDRAVPPWRRSTGRFGAFRRRMGADRVETPGYFGLRQNISFCSHFFIIGAPRFELGTSSPPD